MVKFEILLLEFPSSATCSANSVTFFQNLKVAMKKYLDPKLFLVIRLVTIRASMLAYVVLEFVCVGGCMQCLKVNCTVPSTIPFCFSLSLSLISYTVTDAVYLDKSEEFLMPILEEEGPIT